MSVSSTAGKENLNTKPEQSGTHVGTIKRLSKHVLAHPNLIVIAITLFVIAATVIGTVVSTRDLENKLMDAVFRTNSLASHATAMHLLDYIESRGNGIRALASVLASEKHFTDKVNDLGSYFRYVKTRHVTAIMLFSVKGVVLYSTDGKYKGANLSNTGFWKYVLRNSGNDIDFEKLSNSRQNLYPVLPYVGGADTTNQLLIGEPVLINGKDGKVHLDGAVAFLIDQYGVVGSPFGNVLGLHDTTSRIAIGFFSQNGFPFIHLWSNVSRWNKESVAALQQGGKSACLSCHKESDIDAILGSASQLVTALTKTNLPDSEEDEFLWTASRLTSSSLSLQDSVWYVVVSVDRAPVQASINSYLRGSIILMSGTIVLLVVILSLSFYSYRRNALERQRVQHLEQVANLRGQYEVLIEGSNDGIYILFENKIAFANKKFQDMLGYTLEEIANIDFLQLVAPESRSIIENRVKRFSRGEKIESRYGFLALSKDGKRIPVEVSVTHVPHEGKVRTIGIVRDLSELTSQKQLYEMLFRSAPVGIVIHRNGKIVKANDAAALTLRYQKGDDLVGVQVLSLVHPDDIKIVEERIADVIERNTVAPPIEERYICRDGDYIHVLAISVPVTYEGKQAAMAQFLSIEDRKLLEENLSHQVAQQEQEKIRLSTLLQNLDEGILFQSADGKIEFVNAEFCKIFGFENPAQIIGKLAKDALVEASNRTKYPEEFVGRVSYDVEHKEIVKEHRMEFADGSIVERNALSIFNSLGKYIGRIGVFRDITQREQNEEAIKRLQRTELLGRLAGGIAHDFNNVLGIIIGSLQMMLRKMDNPVAVQENAQRALSSAIRGSEVAKRLLQFVRYSPEGFKDFSVRQIIEETVSIVKHTFEENLFVQTEFVINDANVYGSPGDIQQVLINLAKNSHDAMPDGGTLTFSLTTADRKQVEKKLGGSPAVEYVLLMIQDTGEGIESDKLEKIFDPFFTTKDIGKGTGLGLSIVQTIISAHGGFVDVKSQPGRGTTFFLYFPMSQSKPQSEEPPQESEAAVTHMIGKSATILVVEDEAELRKLLLEYLSEKGFHVVGAANGEEGYRIFQNHPEISVVLSDLGLPKLSGDKLIAKIKAERPDVKCILATGYLTPSADGNLSNVDVKTILKPYNLSAVYNLLVEVLSDKA